MGEQSTNINRSVLVVDRTITKVIVEPSPSSGYEARVTVSIGGSAQLLTLTADESIALVDALQAISVSKTPQ